MADQPDVSHNLTTAAAQDLRPLVKAAAEALDLDQQRTERLGEFMAKAWMAGAQAGQAEMVAQAAEQGANVSVTPVRADDAAS